MAGFVRRVVIDVQVRILREALDDLVDGLLEGALLPGGRHAPLVVAAPEGVEQRLAVRAGLAGLQDAEQVVDAVLAGEGVALEVQVQVAGAGLRQRQQALGRVERAVLALDRLQQLIDAAALVLSADLDGRPAPAPARAPPGACSAALGTSGSSSTASVRRVPISRSVSSARVREVMPATSERWSSVRRRLLQTSCPAAHAAVLHRLRIRRRRGRVADRQGRADLRRGSAASWSGSRP